MLMVMVANNMTYDLILFEVYLQWNHFFLNYIFLNSSLELFVYQKCIELIQALSISMNYIVEKNNREMEQIENQFIYGLSIFKCVFFIP